MKASLKSAFVLTTLCAVAACASTPDYAGAWIGTAETEREDTSVMLTISEEGEALRTSMTLADIGVMGWPATTTIPTDDGLEIQLPSDSGIQTMRLVASGNRLTGTWRETRFEEVARLTLARHKDYTPPSEERLEIAGPAGKLGASLILPVGGGPVPGVVLLHGSGPQPRDTNRFAAHVLAELGIAGLIFDKRGVGASEGKLAGVTFEALAADAIAAAEFLAEQPDISGVGFFGHSQGGWIGPLAGATWPSTAFVISSAGPAVSPAREAEWDVVRPLRRINAGPEAETTARQIVSLWHQALRSGDWAAFDVALEAARGTPWFEQSGLAYFAQRPGNAFIESYTAIMDYDPLPALEKLPTPLLSILAPDDESIDSTETEAILRALKAKGKDITLKLYPGYDHTMRRHGNDGQPVRFPEHPEDYFRIQADFIKAAIP